MTLVEFLLARIAEDEAAARAATGGPWRATPTTGGVLAEGYDTVAMCAISDCGAEYAMGADWQEQGNAEHIARFNPARVLAECSALRRIVDEHKLVASPTTDGIVGCDRCGWLNFSWGPELTEDGPCPTLRFLALPYADHPDYEEAWASPPLESL